MSSVLRINMSSLAVSEAPSPGEDALLGGRALTSHIVAAEVDAEADPVSPEAKLVIAPGLLGGTAATTSGRTSWAG